MTPPRKLVLVAVVVATILSIFPLPIISPLHAFVPEPAFLRSEKSGAGYQYRSTYFTRAARPYMVGTAAIYILLCAIAMFRDSRTLAIALIFAGPALGALTFTRLLLGGGVSGGI